MSPSIVAPPAASVADTKIHVKSGYATVTEALDAAKARFVAKNATSLKLHGEAAKSLPGGNTRSLLHTAPFPVFIKSGEGYQVTSEDGHV
jgi:glutamate-1-semialdehyde 2,1-aminomutase